jgi:hypothetical protein
MEWLGIEFLPKRRMATMLSGQWVPGMEPDDIICVRFGSKDPFGLESIGNAYEIDGE